MDFATDYLFQHMNIDVDEWQQGPQGYYFGGNNMYFTSRNMAKLGYLYLNNGRLNGMQIVPQVWVEESLTNYTNFTGYDWGDLTNVNYGYLWLARSSFIVKNFYPENQKSYLTHY